jgi:hypothetical protein
MNLLPSTPCVLRVGSNMRVHGVVVCCGERSGIAGMVEGCWLDRTIWMGTERWLDRAQARCVSWHLAVSDAWMRSKSSRDSDHRHVSHLAVTVAEIGSWYSRLNSPKPWPA